jgi:GNAT superfamily N-acetyltransferase
MTIVQSRPTTLTTRCHFHFSVRPVDPGDTAALATFFMQVAKEDLRLRFLSGLDAVNHAQISAMIDIDHDRVENFLAFDDEDGALIASAMLATDETGERAEVAMAIRADYKNRGVSWTLLEYVARQAKARGIKTLESIESRDHHAAIELEREMGFTATSCPGDATLVVLRADLTKTSKQQGAAKAEAGMKIRWAYARVGSIPTARTTSCCDPQWPGTGGGSEFPKRIGSDDPRLLLQMTGTRPSWWPSK